MRYQSKIDSYVKIQCPFFIRENLKQITCEGFFGYEVVQSFSSEEEKNEVILNFCMDYPNGCPIALSVEEKYEGGND